MDDVSVQVGDVEYRGWERVIVSRSVEAAVGAVQLELQDGKPLPISLDLPVVVRFGADAVLTGHFDELSAGLDDEEKPFQVQGRDLAGDMLDSSALVDSDVVWFGATLEELATQLAQPFGVRVRVLGDGGDHFTEFSLEPGEGAWEAVERAARFRGLLTYSRGDGGLELARPGTDRASTDLVEGRNITRAQLRLTTRDRYHTYIVRGQRPGSDDDWGTAVASVEARAQDPGVRGQRTLVIIAEASVSPESAELRARWEATVRAARAQTLQVEVPGWREGGTGALWQVNRRVNVHIPTLRLEDAELLIAAVRHEISEDRGVVTDLTLVRPDAYALAPLEESSPFDALFGGDG